MKKKVLSLVMSFAVAASLCPATVGAAAQYEPTNGSDKISNVISCWGDSLTAGSGGGGTSFPSVMQEQLGTRGYTVRNKGVGGETAYTIAARQGAIPMTVNEFTIPAGTEKTEITFANSPAIYPLLQGGSDCINPCSINGVSGKITIENSGLTYVEGETKYYFTRSAEGTEENVSGGAYVTTASSAEKGKGDTLVLFVGTNGPKDVDELISIQKKMIEYNGSNNYLVVGLTYSSNKNNEYIKSVENALQDTYGSKYLDLRAYLQSDKAFADAGISKTSQDESDIANGYVPSSFRYDTVHYNAAGYTIAGKRIAEKLAELGYTSLTFGDGYNSVEVDNNLTRFELTNKNFGADTVRSFDFTPKTTGNYGFYYSNMIWSGNTKPTLNMQVLDDANTAVSLYSKVFDGDIEGEHPVTINFGSTPYAGINSTTVAADGANGSWFKADGTPNAVESYKCNCRIGTRAKYVRIGDKLSLYAKLEAGKKYTIQFTTTGVGFTLDSIDVRSLSIPISGKDVQIPVLDFSDYRSIGAGNNFGKYPLQNLSSEGSAPEFAEGFDIIGDYNSSLLSDKTLPRFITNGVPVYTLNVTTPGTYSFTAHMNSRKAAEQSDIDKGKTFNLQAAMNIAKMTDGTAGNSLIKNEWGGTYSNNTDEKNTDGKLILKETKVYYDTVTYTAELEKGTYNLYCYFNPDGGNGLLYNLTVDYKEPYEVKKLDNNFTRFEINESFENGSEKIIEFTPGRTANYSLTVGTGAYNKTSYCETDVASLNFNITGNDGTEIVKDGVVEPKRYNIQRLEPTNYEAFVLPLKAGVTYSISMSAELADGKTTGSIAFVDLRCLTLDIGAEPTLVSAFDYTSLSDSAKLYTPNMATREFLHTWDEFGLNPIGNYMDSSLKDKDTLATSTRDITTHYTLNFESDGLYKITVYGANLVDIAEGASINRNVDAVLDAQADNEKSFGKAYFMNKSDGIADSAIAKNTLSAMECENSVYVSKGVHTLKIVPHGTVHTMQVYGFKVEPVTNAVDFDVNKISYNTSTITAHASFVNNNGTVGLFVAVYDSNGKLISAVKELSAETAGKLEKSIDVADNAVVAKAFLWDGNLKPLIDKNAVISRSN